MILFLMLLTLTQWTNCASLNDPFDEKMKYIEQRLDNFNKSDNRSWKMRYLESTKYYKPGGPLFISVGGEWALTRNEKLFAFYYELIKIFNAYSIVSEHRYYGNSLPVPDMRAENMEYLTVKQALYDLAVLIRFKKSEVTDLKKVILFGCSYAGTLAAWFKREYPDLADGVWSAGAPFSFRLDYADNAINVGKSIRANAGDDCYDRIGNMSNQYLYLKKINDTKILPKIQALNLTKEYNNIQTTINVHVMHRNKTILKKMCKEMLKLDHDDIIGFGKYLQKQAAKIPDIGSITNTTFSIDVVARQWLYQTCNELGNFESTSSIYQPFGNMSPFSELIGKCKTAFGPKFTIDYINAKIEETNAYFGGYDLGINNAYYTYSLQDPWRFAGIQDERATVIPDIGHCQEFLERSDIDAPTTRAAKQKAIDLIRYWMSNATDRPVL